MTGCRQSKHAIALAKTFIISLRGSIARSSGMEFQDIVPPMHFAPWLTAKECWAIDVSHAYFMYAGHPSPDFRFFDPSILSLIPNDEDARNRCIFTCYMMGKGMRDYVANQLRTWTFCNFTMPNPWLVPPTMSVMARATLL